MNIVIRYFSGTGNTKFAAEEIQKHYVIQGNAVNCDSIETGTPIGSDTELLLIGGPIYAGNVPEHLIRWVIRNVPDASAGAVAIPFSTSAGLLNAFGVTSLAAKLHKKGYTVPALRTFVMPRNYFFGKYEKMSDDIASQLVEKTRIETAELVANQEILSGADISPEKSTLGIDLLAETMSVMTRFMGKSFSANENCIRCGKCVKNCPKNTIKLDKKLKFGLSCMMCTRCIHGCPVHAIEYGKKRYPQYRLNEIVQWKVNE